MKTQQDYKLKASEKAIIERAIKYDKRGQVRRRALALQLLDQGYGPSEVAKQVGVSRRSIYNWSEQFQAQGLVGLVDRPGRGRKRKANELYRQQLEAALAQEPRAYGYGFGIWTLNRLRRHLFEQTGINLSRNRLRALLKELAYVYRRPKHALPEAEAEAVVLFQQKLALVKKKPKPALSNSSLWTKRS
jgi:transposase